MERKNNCEMAAAASGYNFNHQTASSKDEEVDNNGKGCYRDWDTVQVSQWLTNQIKLPQYSEMFSKSQVARVCLLILS